MKHLCFDIDTVDNRLLNLEYKFIGFLDRTALNHGEELISSLV
jgi:hypothetical protein